jgi:hypothetical protein
VTGSCEHDNESSVSVKRGDFWRDEILSVAEEGLC